MRTGGGRCYYQEPDTKNWDGLNSVFSAIVAMIRIAVESLITVHHGHAPDLTRMLIAGAPLSIR